MIKVWKLQPHLGVWDPFNIYDGAICDKILYLQFLVKTL